MTRNRIPVRRGSLRDPRPDETPREREYREGLLALIDWLARKLVDEMVAEVAAKHGVPPESVVLELVEEAPVRARARGRARGVVRESRLGGQ